MAGDKQGGYSKLAPTLLKAGDLDEALMILTVRILVAENSVDR